MSLVEHLPPDTYLRKRHVSFSVAPHTGTYTARSEARALGLPSDSVLKTVVLRVGDEFAIGVIPASRRLNINLVRRVAPSGRVRLATEDEIAARFPDYELGAVPPLPGVLGVKAYVDPTVFDHDEVAFADGKQTESIVASPKDMFWGEDAFVAPISQDPSVWGPWGPEGDAVSFG